VSICSSSLLLAGCACALALGACAGSSTPAVQERRVFTDDLPAGSIAIYVSSDGDDTNDGSSPQRALQTPAHALSLARDGAGDRVLLRRGDRFELEAPLRVEVSGASERAPFVLGVHGDGDARAILATRGEHGLALVGPDPSRPIEHVRIEGLALEELRAVEVVGDGVSEGVHVVAPDGATATARDITLEDVSIRGYGVGVSALGTNTEGGIRDLRLHHVLVLDTRHAHNAIGLLFSRVRGLELDEIVVDRVQRDGRPPSVFDHSVYVQTDCEDVVVRGSIFARAPDGVMQRAGGVLEDNLVVDVAIGALEGYVFGGAVPTPGGVTFRVSRNVFLDLGDLSPELGRGIGLYVGNVRSGVVSENVIARSRAASPWSSWAFAIMGETNDGNVGVLDLELVRNEVHDVPMLAHISGVRVQSVRFEDNLVALRPGPTPTLGLDEDLPIVFVRTRGALGQRLQIGAAEIPLAPWLAQHGQASIADATSARPLRDVAAYHASIGGGPSLEAFLDSVRAQSGRGWRAALGGRAASAWIRGAAP
jgi:hypothetical protein